MSAPHLCMLALTAYPVLARRRDSRELGGAQVQQVMIARTLVQAGMRVSFICMDYGQPARERIDGIDVLRIHAPGAGLPGLRFFYPRLTDLMAAMKAADADVYYQRCAAGNTGLMTAWCQAHGRGSIFAGASDLDFIPLPPTLGNTRDRWLYRRGVRQASAVVVQNPRQQELLRAHHGRDGILIPSCYLRDPAPAAVAATPREVLWVGMVREPKRPDRFLALARALPHVSFRMVGGPMGDSPAVLAYYESIRAEAASLPNLQFTGFVPYDQVDSYFDQAAILVNTSDHEGFPNTFLQAWARDTPAVALFDTGSRVDGQAPYGLVASEAEMAALVGRLMADPAERQALGLRGRDYYERHHAPQVTAARYGELIETLRPSRRRSAA